MDEEPKVTRLDDHRPHLTVSTFDGRTHVFPVSVFERIIGGGLNIMEVDDWEKVMRSILAEWLQNRLSEGE